MAFRGREATAEPCSRPCAGVSGIVFAQDAAEPPPSQPTSMPGPSARPQRSAGLRSAGNRSHRLTGGEYVASDASARSRCNEPAVAPAAAAGRLEHHADRSERAAGAARDQPIRSSDPFGDRKADQRRRSDQRSRCILQPTQAEAGDRRAAAASRRRLSTRCRRRGRRPLVRRTAHADASAAAQPPHAGRDAACRASAAARPLQRALRPRSITTATAATWTSSCNAFRNRLLCRLDPQHLARHHAALQPRPDGRRGRSRPGRQAAAARSRAPGGTAAARSSPPAK